MIKIFKKLISINNLLENNTLLLNECNNLKSRTMLIQDNIETILNTNKSIISIFTLSESLYIICIPKYIKLNQIIDFGLYNISQQQSNLISVAGIEMNNLKIEIISIDTFQEQRHGHASKLLREIEKFANSYNCQTVYGEIWLDSPIGFDSLNNFYIKNGYKTGSKYFKKSL